MSYRRKNRQKRTKKQPRGKPRAQQLNEKRKRERQQAHRVDCPYCGERAVFTSSREVYGGRDYGKIYLCRPCDAYVGVHKGTNRPLGRLANAELRKAKIEAHRSFDPLWKSGEMERRNAYAWLAHQLGIPARQCHIGMFDVEMCERVVEVCVNRVNQKWSTDEMSKVRG